MSSSFSGSSKAVVRAAARRRRARNVLEESYEIADEAQAVLSRVRQRQTPVAQEPANKTPSVPSSTSVVPSIDVPTEESEKNITESIRLEEDEPARAPLKEPRAPPATDLPSIAASKSVDTNTKEVDVDDATEETTFNPNDLRNGALVRLVCHSDTPWSLGRNGKAVPTNPASICLRGLHEFIRYGSPVHLLDVEEYYLGPQGWTSTPQSWFLEPAVLGEQVRVDQESPTITDERHVQSGDAILLRNDQGILAVDRQGQLFLKQEGLEGRSILQVDDPHVLNVQPPLIFHFLPVQVPSIPLWSFQESKGLYSEKDTPANLFTDPPKIVMDNTGMWEEKYEEELSGSTGQELLLVDELIGALGGFSAGSTLIGLSGRSFNLQKPVDSSLGALVDQILPLANARLLVEDFIKSSRRYDSGCVRQACGQGMETIVQEYFEFWSTLDSTMTLQALQVRLGPALGAFTSLAQIVESIQSFSGGALLNALGRVPLRGNFRGQALLDQLMLHAKRPYMQIMKEWLEKGNLDDPYNEFMVSRVPGQNWQRQFHVVPEHVLEGLSDQTVERIVATGKYRSAAAGATVKVPFADRLVPFVQAHYHSASRELVRKLVQDFDLMGALRMVKRYFLLEHGDFFVHFMDASEHELRQELPNVSFGQVQHLLNMSIQWTEQQSTSTQKGCLSACDLKCAFASEGLIDQLDRLHAGGLETREASPQRQAYAQDQGLTGMQSFVLNIPDVPFPLSLILDEQSVMSYQLLFRLLLLAKHAERRLVAIWQDHQAMKEMVSLRKLMGKTFVLRQRMLHYVQNLIYHIFEVVEPNWMEMANLIESTCLNHRMTVDDVINFHRNFLQKTFQDCLLVDKESIRLLTKLLTTCGQFCDQMAHFRNATRIDNDRQVLAYSRRMAMHQSLNSRGRLDNAQTMEDLHKAMQASRNERRASIHRQGLRVRREIDNETYSTMILRFEHILTQDLDDFLLLLSTRSDSSFGRACESLERRLSPVTGSTP